MELSPEGQGLPARSQETGEAWVLAGPRAQVLARASEALARGVRVGIAVGGEAIDRAEIRAMIAAGIGELHAVLHAADAAAHDFLAGAEGSLQATVATLRAARVERVPVAVTTPLSRSNTRVLAGLPGLLADVEAAAWRVVVRAGSEGLTPRLTVALPFALQAIVAAERVGVAAAIEGAPLCLLGPLRGRSLPGAVRSFAPVCAECPSRAACPGVDPEYLRRFAGEELSPRALRPAEGRARGAVDMFRRTWIEVQG